MTRTVLCPEWIVDGMGGAPLTGQVVVVDGELIEAVTPLGQVRPQPGDARIDLPGVTLIPGLFNNHVHTVLPGDNTPFPDVQFRTDDQLRDQATRNLALALAGGVTTLRDCGARGTVAIALRDRQAKGAIPGARVISCAWPLTVKGGHVRYFGGEADGPEAVQAMVRRVAAAGADYVKVMASGGGTPGTLSHVASYSVDELKAIAETAHALGLKASAHCTSTIAISNAADAGFDLIEHAIFDDEDAVYRFNPAVAEKLARSNIYVSSTLEVSRDMLDLPVEGADRSMWQRLQDTVRDATRRLHALGVPLLAGSDAGWRATRFDTFWKELDELVTCGLSPVAAIHATTGAPSRAWGLDNRIGAIRPGLAADLVAVDGNAAANIRCLANVRFVYQRGVQAYTRDRGLPD